MREDNNEENENSIVVQYMKDRYQMIEFKYSANVVMPIILTLFNILISIVVSIMSLNENSTDETNNNKYTNNFDIQFIMSIYLFIVFIFMVFLIYRYFIKQYKYDNKMELILASIYYRKAGTDEEKLLIKQITSSKVRRLLLDEINSEGN